MPQIIKRLIELESDVHYQELALPGEEETGYTQGSIPVLLSAPHGAAHTRNGHPKEEDEYTAGLARLIAEMTGAHVLYLRRRSPEDPNWDPDPAYRRQLAAVVQDHGIGFILDIYGAVFHTDFGVTIGTMGGESCPNHRELIIDTFAKYGLRPNGEGLDRLDVDKSFSGRGQSTIMRFACQELGVPAAQFEINGHLRIIERRDDASSKRQFWGEPRRIDNTVRAFVSLVRALAHSVGTGDLVAPDSAARAGQ